MTIGSGRADGAGRTRRLFTMPSTPSAISQFMDRRQGLLYPAPAVIVLFLIVVLPIAFNIYLAFTKWTVGLGQPIFVGFDNFIDLVSDDRVWNGVKVMVYFSGLSLALRSAWVCSSRFISIASSGAAKSSRRSISFRLRPRRWRSR